MEPATSARLGFLQGYSMGIYDKGQLRGAYSAGFEAGLLKGTETMRREGWRRVQSGSELVEGEIVKALEPTMGGWKGFGRVISVSGESVRVLKMDKMTGNADADFWNTADFLVDQIARKVVDDL